MNANDYYVSIDKAIFLVDNLRFQKLKSGKPIVNVFYDSVGPSILRNSKRFTVKGINYNDKTREILLNITQENINSPVVNGWNLDKIAERLKVLKLVAQMDRANKNPDETKVYYYNSEIPKLTFKVEGALTQEEKGNENICINYINEEDSFREDSFSSLFASSRPITNVFNDMIEVVNPDYKLDESILEELKSLLKSKFDSQP